jgi:hypothetical protein
VRDLEVIDSELRLLLAIRHMAREAEGRTPNTARIDALLDERSATMVLNTTDGLALARRPRSSAARHCGGGPSHRSAAFFASASVR